MRIDMLGLEAFIAIAERGSFHAAASHLNLSQTALSHRIRKLEESLGAELLTRTTRQVSLTEAGATLLPRARRLFDDLDAALDDVRSQASDMQERVVIGCLPTIAMQCMPEVIADFALRRPNVAVKLLDSSASDIAEKVQSGEAEFGITIVAANRWNLDLKAIAKEPFVLVCSRKLPIAANASLTWAEIGAVPLVRISAETGNRILIDDALGTRRETLNWRYEVQRVTTAISLVRSGIGGAIVPQLGVSIAVAGAQDLVAIPIRGPLVTRTLGLVTRKGAPLTPAARELRKLVIAALKASFARGGFSDIS
ncbi:MAG TPA: LysR family transcriptional regulator [Beijerinckiaceae bacterium]|nr:LysR family transcriptional regulator [Beijerinckiaceae bacterium]